MVRVGSVDKASRICEGCLGRTRGSRRNRPAGAHMAYCRDRPVVAMQHRPAAYHSRNSMLENQLLLTVVLEQYGIFVEGANFPRKLHAAHKVNGYGGLIFPDRVQKRVLDILCRLIIHVPISRSHSYQLTLKIEPLPLKEDSVGTCGGKSAGQAYKIPPEA